MWNKNHSKGGLKIETGIGDINKIFGTQVKSEKKEEKLYLHIKTFSCLFSNFHLLFDVFLIPYVLCAIH